MDLIKAVDGVELSEWLAHPNRNQERLKAICPEPHSQHFLERLQDVQSGRASLSPCRLPLLSLSNEEVKRFLEGEEFQRFSTVWGKGWYEDLDGRQLHEAVNNDMHIKALRRCPLNIPLTKEFINIIHGYYSRGVPEEKMPEKVVEVGMEANQLHGGEEAERQIDGGERRRSIGKESDEERGERKENFEEKSREDRASVPADPLSYERAEEDRGDIPAESLKDDKYGKDHIGTSILAEALAEMIFDGASLPLVIGLFAPWGAGKSFILEKVETHMKYLILTRNLIRLRELLKGIYVKLWQGDMLARLSSLRFHEITKINLEKFFKSFSRKIVSNADVAKVENVTKVQNKEIEFFFNRMILGPNKN